MHKEPTLRRKNDHRPRHSRNDERKFLSARDAMNVHASFFLLNLKKNREREKERD